MPRTSGARRTPIHSALAAAFLVAACAAGSPPAASPSTAGPSVEPSVVPACTPHPAKLTELGRLARTGPAAGAWVGMNIDWGTETVADVTARLGRPPADVVSFVGFPLATQDARNLDAAAQQAHDAGAVLVATLEPSAGLDAITDDALTALTERLVTYGRDEIPTIVRFAHEMNGSWYPWGQDPIDYVAAFRRVADAVHADVPNAALLWAPNQGDGYPYAGGKYEAKAGSAAARALDTNGDGKVTGRDDPYAPYWPGASYVDWVGMSLYHWGTIYPWGANVVPKDGKFSDLVTGATTTSARVPDFYADYAERYAKPLAIVETAALYRPAGRGASEASIKEAWLGEVLSPATLTRFPRLKLVNWFEWRKNEVEVGDVVDWRISAEPRLRAAFLAAVGDGFELGAVVAHEAGCSAG